MLPNKFHSFPPVVFSQLIPASVSLHFINPLTLVDRPTIPIAPRDSFVPLYTLLKEQGKKRFRPLTGTHKSHTRNRSRLPVFEFYNSGNQRATIVALAGKSGRVANENSSRARGAITPCVEAETTQQSGGALRPRGG